MPQLCCLNVHDKCDLEQESKQVLETWNLRRVKHESKYDTKIMNYSIQAQNLIEQSLSSLLNFICQILMPRIIKQLIHI